MRVIRIVSMFIGVGLTSLFCVTDLGADSIVYDSNTNQWTISGFEATGVGNYTETGTMAGSGPHVRNGLGMSAGWQELGGWNWHNSPAQNDFTDFWHPDTLEWTVTGATWSNTITNADGEYSLWTDNGATLGTAIADGTLLNGTFTWQSNTGSGGTGVLIYEGSVIPEPSSMALLGVCLIAGFVRRRR